MRVVRRQIDIYPPPTAGTGGGGNWIHKREADCITLVYFSWERVFW
jgi:hypothetical protein